MTMQKKVSLAFAAALAAIYTYQINQSYSATGSPATLDWIGLALAIGLFVVNVRQESAE